MRYPGVGAFASPNAEIQGNMINPLATESLQSILAGDVAPEARTEILRRLGDIEGAEVSWVRGPSPVETAAVTGESSGPSAEFLGESVDIETFGGIANSSFVNSPTVNGSKALRFTNMYAPYGIESTSGLPNYPHQGDQFRA